MALNGPWQADGASRRGHQLTSSPIHPVYPTDPLFPPFPSYETVIAATLTTRPDFHCPTHERLAIEYGGNHVLAPLSH